MDFKIIIGVLAVVIGFLGYLPYVRDTFRGVTKPHLFSWAIWGLIETIAFIVQVQAGAGAGAWVTGFSALIVFIIVIKAFSRSDKNITIIDWFSFVIALLGVIAWRLTKNPAAAVIIISIADAIAFIPTYRKALRHPHEETLAEYAASSLKHTLGILALQNYNLATWLYPASLMATNSIFVLMVAWRRKYEREK